MTSPVACFMGEINSPSLPGFLGPAYRARVRLRGSTMLISLDAFVGNLFLSFEFFWLLVSLPPFVRPKPSILDHAKRLAIGCTGVKRLFESIRLVVYAAHAPQRHSPRDGGNASQESGVGKLGSGFVNPGKIMAVKGLVIAQLPFVWITTSIRPGAHRHYPDYEKVSREKPLCVRNCNMKPTSPLALKWKQTKMGNSQEQNISSNQPPIFYQIGSYPMESSCWSHCNHIFTWRDPPGLLVFINKDGSRNDSSSNWPRPLELSTEPWQRMD
ncbi:predicted protein [Histoplasma capsulatum G186AR]|uniref:Uncharacterized protein n=1 Tax=Ajellomyces capsulatus (strain G186AR / H82 / ATCC MYA-2454 / RMSCC 2432) TaxID=447093 RepID=C0NNM4_AJECG|nr:uncharacterized protein HCBG_04754 [Histoplasma capsulatum G186AR]EEH06534.1 predicted protein [Histoplasma capsulatum G186AR]